MIATSPMWRASRSRASIAPSNGSARSGFVTIGASVPSKSDTTSASPGCSMKGAIERGAVHRASRQPVVVV